MENLPKTTTRIVKLFHILQILLLKKNEKFYAEIAKQVDKVDILVANAGASWGAPLEDHPVSAVKSPQLECCCRLPHHQVIYSFIGKAGTKEDPSRLILMSSVISYSTNDMVGVYGYLSSKAAVSHLGRNLSVQFAPRHINVNSIAPRFFPSKWPMV